MRQQAASVDVAACHARALLASRGCGDVAVPDAEVPHPAEDWARCGAMALTGRPDAAPRPAPGPLAACARGALRALEALAGLPLPVDGPALLGERAALRGLARRGRVSPGGSARLLRAGDGWLAVNLARPDDRALLPAWLGEGDTREPWAFVAGRVRERPAAEVVERARLLGLPVAEAGPPDPGGAPWCRVAARGEARERFPATRPLVLDLSSLWAGPLCTHLLALAGARVVKLESPSRPDGARAGEPRFFDLLNAGKASVAVDLSGPGGRDALRDLIARADVVVESARPRALAQLGIAAAQCVAETPGLTWVSITGYGRQAPCGNWVAFGDDAAAAAGLAAAVGDADGPLFCADAIADPLTGLHAAVAALASFRRGGGELLDLALRDVAAHALAAPLPDVGPCPRELRARPPRSRAVRGRARALGADTDAVLRELGVAC